MGVWAWLLAARSPEYAECTYTDVRIWTDLPGGGHFTAKQTPDLVGGAMRDFFASI